jgi:hypothetical protein
MTSRDAGSRPDRLFAELEGIPLLQSRRDDDTIDVNRSRLERCLAPLTAGAGRTETFLFA